MQTAPSILLELRCSACGQFDTAYFAPDQSVGCYSCGIHPTIEEELPTTSACPASTALHAKPRVSPGWRRRLDFAAINQAALARWPEVVARLLPAGRAFGNEWCVGSLRGEPGRSLKVRLRGDRAGAWCDFATGEKGGDPISLAAAVAGLSRVEAARRLRRMLGMEGTEHG